jgi:peptide/nickel transport system permease protein
MAAYIVRRCLYAILTFFGITIATFTLIHSVPGDPITFYLMSPKPPAHAALEAMRREYHLDKPLLTQYGYWVKGIVTLDLGRSTLDRRPVSDRILEKLPNTFLLNVIAFIVAALIGLPIGLWSAARSGRALERASAVGFFLLYSLPSFWVGLLLMETFSVHLDVLPLFGMTRDEFETLTFTQQLADRAQHLILPVITLAYAQVAIFARFTKSALTEVIRQDFITTARAKGAAPAAVMLRHALRNALIPLVTLLGLTIPSLISGSVIVEAIFQWDGIGHLYLESILRRDYPTVLGLTVATAVVTLFASLLADVLYAVADPRIRLGEEQR